MDKALCKYCGKQFKSKSAVYDHENRHQGKAPYMCCSKKFQSRANLKRHRCAVHGDRKDFTCDNCGKKFAIKADLNRHVKSHEDPSFKCDICGLFSRKKQDHVDHMTTHTGEKSHRCPCGKSFRHQSNLYRHKRMCKTN